MCAGGTYFCTAHVVCRGGLFSIVILVRLTHRATCVHPCFKYFAVSACNHQEGGPPEEAYAAKGKPAQRHPKIERIYRERAFVGDKKTNLRNNPSQYYSLRINLSSF